jgi:hypothetical protein
MPGRRPANYREGDRTELLVECFLNVLAFTTRVPRQEDVGHDLFCTLAEPKGAMLWAGPSFTVQTKSEASPLMFEEEHELAWIKGLENPFFVAVGTKKEMRVEIYATWQRVGAGLQGGASKIVLALEVGPNGMSEVVLASDGTQTVYAGKPILSVTLSDVLTSKEAVEKCRNVLEQWIAVDRENITCSRAGIHFAVGPGRYKTNEPPDLTAPQRAVFWNPNNLAKCTLNLGRVAAALRLTADAARSAGAPLPDSKIRALDELLVAWEDAVDPLAKHALAETVGLRLR